MEKTIDWSETIPKLLDDDGEIPKSQGTCWRFDSRLRISSLLDITLSKRSTAPCALALAYQPSAFLFLCLMKKEKHRRKPHPPTLAYVVGGRLVGFFNHHMASNCQTTNTLRRFFLVAKGITQSHRNSKHHEPPLKTRPSAVAWSQSSIYLATYQGSLFACYFKLAKYGSTSSRQGKAHVTDPSNLTLGAFEITGCIA